jgi:hypothetical protein
MPLSQGQETELYDYRSHNGRLELDNSAGHSPLEGPLRAQLDRAFARELRAPLPPRLTAAAARGFSDYLSTARRAAKGAAAMRKRRTERDVGPVDRAPGPDTQGDSAPVPRPSRPARHR